MAQTIKPATIPKSTLEHFRAIPWVKSHLSDSSFHVVSMSRTLTQPGDGHSLMAETWNTDKTITQLLSTYRPPESTTGQSGEVRRFYTFGTGLNAHPNLLHGGVIATILDSTMGNVIARQMPGKAPTFTVALNITYKKPITTPGTVVARSWITKIEGRKLWVHGAIESGTGELYANADGMWLTAKPKI